MPWNEWIAKHAKLVVAIWIAAIILATPLAARLNDVTNYSMNQFLPKDVESVKVMNSLSKQFPEFAGSENQTYLLIDGINVNDKRAREDYYSFKAGASKYGYNFTSYYDALDLLSNKSYEVAFNITRLTANLTDGLYNSTIEMNRTYGVLLDNLTELENSIDSTRGALKTTAEAYLNLTANLSEAYKKTMILRTALNETDAAYAELNKNLTLTSRTLRTINSTLYRTNTGLYTLNITYGKGYLGSIAVYRALGSAGAYSSGVLSPEEAKTIADSLNVTPQFVYAVFNATYPVYSTYGPHGITDILLANVTRGIVLAGLNDTTEERLAEAYSYAFYLAVNDLDRQLGSYYAIENMPEAALVSTINTVASSALKGTPEVVLSSGKPMILPGFGSVEPKLLAEIVNTSIKLGPNPSPEKVEWATAEFALYYIRSTTPNNPLLSLPGPESVLFTLLHSGPTRTLEVNLLREGMMKRADSETRPFVPLIVNITLSTDPNASGALTTNGTALEDATVSIMEKILTSRGIPLDKGTLKSLYESGGNMGRIGEITANLIRSKLVETLRARKIQEPERAANAIVNEVIKDPWGIANGSVLENATIDVVVSLAPPGVPSLSGVVKRLYEGDEVGAVAGELFLQGVRDKLKNEDIPTDVKTSVMGIARLVPDEYPLTETEIEELVRKNTVELVSPELSGNQFTKDINASLVVSLGMRFREHPNALTKGDVKPIADIVYRELYSTAKPFISMLKSSDNKTLMIIFVPKGLPGEDDIEKASHIQYDNAIGAKKLALETFGRDYHGVKAYVTGTPVQTYEAIKYGKEDNDKTTKFSVLGAFLVLLALMGAALLATILPFTGVATATLTSLGILYLLAKGDVVDIGSWAQMLTVTTALGLGIDYSTYYVHRFKEFIAEGYDHEKAASEALKRAKDAVLASASTDIIAFASFVLAYEFPIFKTIGMIAPLAVIIVLIASLTLIPAITVLIGDKTIFWWPRHIKHVQNINIHERSKIAEWVTKHAKVVALIFLLIAIPAAYNFANFNGTHDVKLFIPKDSETYHFLNIADEKIGAAVTSPTYVIVDLGHPVTNSDLQTIEALSRNISSINGVEHVFSPAMPYGTHVNNMNLDTITQLGGDKYISTNDHKILIEVIGKYAATDDRSKNMVNDIRTYLKAQKAKGIIKDAKVGGNTALALDLSNLINNVFWHRIFPVALLLMFLSLVPTLKGLPAVLSTMATIATGVLLSIWLSSWLFERVFNQQVMWFLPMMVFIVLMGVGIDYNSFYLVKARDEFERRSPRDALIVAAGTMDTIVIGLAAVLATTYGALMTGASWGIREIGFALAIGVLLTSFAAVYFLGPALMELAGEKAWWPLHRVQKK